MLGPKHFNSTENVKGVITAVIPRYETELTLQSFAFVDSAKLTVRVPASFVDGRSPVENGFRLGFNDVEWSLMPGFSVCLEFCSFKLNCLGGQRVAWLPKSRPNSITNSEFDFIL